MKAQVLYDLREEIEFCSGNDLHQFFLKETGDPSPSGKVQVDASAALAFVNAELDGQHQNNIDPAFRVQVAQARTIAQQRIR